MKVWKILGEPPERESGSETEIDDAEECRWKHVWWPPLFWNADVEAEHGGAVGGRRFRQLAASGRRFSDRASSKTHSLAF